MALLAAAACANVYEARFPLESPTQTAEEAGIDPCLRTLGFSALPRTALEEPEKAELEAGWSSRSSAPEGDARAAVWRRAGGWEVQFAGYPQPGGSAALLYAGMFSDCITERAPSLRVTITADTPLEVE
jgi:hypothetical protein